MKTSVCAIAIAVALAAVMGLTGCEKATTPVTPLVPMKPGYPEPADIGACSKAPVIDGDLSDACWKSAEVLGPWIDFESTRAAKIETKIFVCYDDKNLYVAFLNTEPKMKSLKADATDRDSDVWLDDADEIFIDPSAGKEDYFQFIVNTKNVLYDGKDRDGSWNSTAKSAVKKMDDGWSLEIAIPLSEIAVTAPVKGQTWKANFCRDRRVEGEGGSSSWSDTGDTFHNVDGFGTLKMK